MFVIDTRLSHLSSSLLCELKLPLQLCQYLRLRTSRYQYLHLNSTSKATRAQPYLCLHFLGQLLDDHLRSPPIAGTACILRQKIKHQLKCTHCASTHTCAQPPLAVINALPSAAANYLQFRQFISTATQPQIFKNTQFFFLCVPTKRGRKIL